MTERKFTYEDYCWDGTPCPAKAALGISHDSEVSYTEHGALAQVLWVFDQKTAPMYDDEGGGFLTERQAKRAWLDAVEEVKSRPDPPADLSGSQRVAEELGWSS